MSYENGRLQPSYQTELSSESQSQIVGPPGPKGDGFKLTSDGNYDMQNKKLTNLKEGSSNNDAITKHQLDNAISNIPSVDLSPYLKKDGSTQLTRFWNVGNQVIYNVLNTNDPSTGKTYADQLVSVKWIRDHCLQLDGTNNYGSNLDMTNHRISNLSSGILSNDGVNKSQLDSATNTNRQ